MSQSVSSHLRFHGTLQNHFLSETSLLFRWNATSHVIITQSKAVRCHGTSKPPNPVGIKTRTRPAVSTKSTCWRIIMSDRHTLCTLISPTSQQGGASDVEGRAVFVICCDLFTVPSRTIGTVREMHSFVCLFYTSKTFGFEFKRWVLDEGLGFQR